MSAYESFAAAGGLASYGASASATLRRAAAMADRVLRGARPGDVPLELPTQFVLSLNLRTAPTLKLQIPRSMLLRADEVIE
jgi:putative ABC transport system substrate-binding protein